MIDALALASLDTCPMAVGHSCNLTGDALVAKETNDSDERAPVSNRQLGQAIFTGIKFHRAAEIEKNSRVEEVELFVGRQCRTLDGFLPIGLPIRYQVDERPWVHLLDTCCPGGLRYRVINLGNII
jgi:hypothetical protein